MRRNSVKGNSFAIVRAPDTWAVTLAFYLRLVEAHVLL